MMFNRSFVYLNAESKCVSSSDDSIHPEVIITQVLVVIAFCY